MTTPLFDYALVDRSGVASRVFGIDIPPAAYGAQLEPFGLTITDWQQDGSIEGNQFAAGVADITAGVSVIASQSKFLTMGAVILGIVVIGRLLE